MEERICASGRVGGERFYRRMNNLTLNGDPIVLATVVIEVSEKDVRGISNAALFTRIVLARTPLPDLPVVDVSLTGRMSETQKSTRNDWNGIFEIGDASESAIELAVDVVGKILISNLGKGKGYITSISQLDELLLSYPWKPVTVE